MVEAFEAGRPPVANQGEDRVGEDSKPARYVLLKKRASGSLMRRSAASMGLHGRGSRESTALLPFHYPRPQLGSRTPSWHTCARA
eukprot:scaffold64777_cov62-Phaeocystis_antarctica.AAC.1